MKKYQILFLFVVMTLLSSCASVVYQTKYAYKPPQTKIGMMCVSRCVQTKQNCEKTCKIRDEMCRLREHQKAFYRYQTYSNRMKAQGRSVDRGINSFDNSYLTCNQTCACSIHFNQCYQHCGGTVTPHEVCAAYCD